MKECDKPMTMEGLEHDLIAAAEGPKIELSVAEIRKRGLVPLLRERLRKR